MEFFETAERNNSLYPWGIGIPPRAFDRESGTTIPLDSIISIDGLPISIEGRAKDVEWSREGEEVIRGAKRIMGVACKLHVFSMIYVFFFVLLGFLWQGWLI